MYDTPEDWDEWIEDLVMEADAGDEEDDFSEDDDEAVTPRQRRQAARQARQRGRAGGRAARPPPPAGGRGAPPRRPAPRARYGSDVKGKSHVDIDTPAGKAKVEMPESMVTVQEAQGAFENIAQDMKAQADGLREVAGPAARRVVCAGA